MQESEIRLECLKLACRPGLDPNEIIATARVYLGWVSGTPTTPEQGPGKGQRLLPPERQDRPRAADKPSTTT